ncbi:MAG: phosphate acyltransferase PlsX [Phycisphaerales bacterium]
MRIAVDVMGGDHAPDAILRGCLDALELLAPEDELVLIGSRRDLDELLADRGVKDPRVRCVHTSQVIGMDESPAKAIKSKPDSSIVKMAWLGSKRSDLPCDFVLSAGNTGACVAAATTQMRRLPGVHRPGIAVTIPALNGPLVLCDAGANPEPRPTHLWQYGLMSSVYAERALGIARPRVAMMNIGAEEGKGTELIARTHELLKSSATSGHLDYIGFIEGRELFENAADVVVTDGFVGNTMLKMAEGFARSLMKAIVTEVMEHDPGLMTGLEPVFKRLHKKNDYHEYGGAPLLGVNGVCIIAHGSSESRTVKAAIRNCRQIVTSGVNKGIVEKLAAVGPLHHSSPDADASREETD